MKKTEKMKKNRRNRWRIALSWLLIMVMVNTTAVSAFAVDNTALVSGGYLSENTGETGLTRNADASAAAEGEQPEGTDGTQTGEDKDPAGDTQTEEGNGSAQGDQTGEGNGSAQGDQTGETEEVNPDGQTQGAQDNATDSQTEETRDTAGDGEGSAQDVLNGEEGTEGEESIEEEETGEDDPAEELVGAASALRTAAAGSAVGNAPWGSQTPTYANLVVFVDFADTTHAHTSSSYSCYTQDTADVTLEYFNGSDSKPRGMRQYLYNISYGQLRVENIFPQYDQVNNTIRPYTLSQNASYYANNEAALIMEVAKLLDGKLDSTQKLNYHNTDKVLDNLTIVVPCDSGNQTLKFNAHKTTYGGGSNISINGYSISDYNILTEGGIYYGLKQSGQIIHEFLHTVGYPDLYCNDGVPVYTWDIMSSCSYAVQYPLAYLRSAYTHWFNIDTVTQSRQQVTLYAPTATDETNKDQQALILKTGYSDNEFFVVEYRKKADQFVNGTYYQGYDAKIPGSGLIIYRVNLSTEYKMNRTGKPWMIYVFRPGDTYESGENARGDYIYSSFLSAESGNTSYGSSDFTQSLEQGAITYADGTNSGIVISNVGSAGGDTITFDITFNQPENGTYWTTEAEKTDGGTPAAVSSCTDGQGSLYYLIKEGSWISGTTYLYQYDGKGYNRLGTAPSGTSHQIVMYGGVLYTAYLDSSYKVHLAKWTGSSWTNLTTSAVTAYELSLTADTSGVYVAYPNGDATAVYVTGYNGKNAVDLGQAASGISSAANPSVTAENGRIAVMYREYLNNNIVATVKLYNSSTGRWISLTDGSMVTNNGMVKLYNQKLYLLKNGAGYGKNDDYLYVYDLKDSAKGWQVVGDGPYASISIAEKDLFFVGGQPYVVYMSGATPYTTEVKRLKDGAWTSLGGSVTTGGASGLCAYVYQDQVVVTYLSEVNNHIYIRSHDAENESTDRLLWQTFPDALNYVTVEAGNPFDELVDRTENNETAQNPEQLAQSYGESYGSQLTDALSLELYQAMVETYVEQGLTGEKEIIPTNNINFAATVKTTNNVSVITANSAYNAAQEKLRDSFTLAFSAFSMDHPEVYWLKDMQLLAGWGYDSSTAQGYLTKLILVPGEEYYASASGQQKDFDAAVESALTEIENRVEDKTSRYEYVKAIYEYLCENLTYNEDAAKALYTAGYGYAHTAAAAFLGYGGEKSLTSEGYARAFKILCDRLNIPCAMVMGQAGTGEQTPWVWNMVKMDDDLWYGIDAALGESLYDNANEAWFLAGSIDVEGTASAFADAHEEDGLLAGADTPCSFAYPELALGEYILGYVGTLHVTAETKELVISEEEAGKTLTQEDILTILKKRSKYAPFTAITIIRNTADDSQAKKTIAGKVINEVVPLLAASGTLNLQFRDGSSTIGWQFTDPVTTDSDKNADIIAAKSSTGVWNLQLTDTDYPAKQVSLWYTGTALQAVYGTAKEGDSLYFYRTDADGERSLTAQGTVTRKTAEEVGITGTEENTECAILNLSLTNNSTGLEKGVDYQAELSRFDWRLEHGSDLSANTGTISWYTDEEQLVQAAAGLSNETIRISSVGEEQPEEITAQLLYYCTTNHLTLEISRVEEGTGDVYTWIVENVTGVESVQSQDGYSLQLSLAAQDADIPLEFTERTYLQVITAGKFPARADITLRITSQEMTEHFAGISNLQLWKQKGTAMTHLDTAVEVDQTGHWLQFALQPGQTGQDSYVITTQTAYGWQSAEDAKGQSRHIYLENRTGNRVTGWQVINGRKCYFDADGYLAEGPTRIDGSWMLFGSLEEETQGLITGLCEMDGNTCYADSSGLIRTGWQKIEDVWHYFSAEETNYGVELPSVQEGYWVIISSDAEKTGEFAGRRYYFKKNTTLLNNWQTIDGSRYYFTAQGYAVTGWYPNEAAKNASYFDNEGRLQQGYLTVGEAKYFLDDTGVRQYGWQKIDGSWHFFRDDAGEDNYGQEAVCTSVDGTFWVVMDNDYYYFLNNSKLAKGWQTIDGSRYYFDERGRRVKGTQKIGNKCYYFYENGDEEAVLATGLVTVGDKTYYADASGVLQTGWQKLDGTWQYFDTADGTKEESSISVNYWASVGGGAASEKLYYFINGTKVATGWQTIEGKRYYFDQEGILQTGFFTIGSNTYYGRENTENEKYPGEVLTGAQTIGGKEYYFASDHVMLVGFRKIDGKWCYYSEAQSSPERGSKQELSEPVIDGSAYWYTAGEEKYCLLNDMTVLKNWQTLGGHRYYFDAATGAAATGGTQTIDGQVYCFDADGVMLQETVKDGYYYGADGARAGGWQKLGNEWHYFDPDTGQEVSVSRDDGWVTITKESDDNYNNTYYLNDDATPVKGWQTIDGKRYYFDKTGVLQKGNAQGLYQLGSSYYYLGQDGALSYGWITGTDGSTYYAAGTGVLVSGWQKIDGKWYYFSRETKAQDKEALVGEDNFAAATEAGIKYTYYFIRGTTLAKGWQTIGGSRYYFDANGIMQTQKTKIGNLYYFFGPDGQMRTGFVKYCDTMYYFNGNGQMVRGWLSLGSAKYYFDDEGAMQTGLVKVGKSTWYFSEENATLGQMQKGLQSIDGENYYFNSNGILLTGWQKVEGQWRFFDPSTGKESQVTDAGNGWRTITLPEGRGTERSYFLLETTPAKGWQKIDGKRYYFDSNGCQWTQSKGWLTLGSNRYYFNEADDDSVYQGFLTLADAQGKDCIYYLNSNGQMVKGWQTIRQGSDSSRYYFGTDGVRRTGLVKIGRLTYHFDEQGILESGFFTDDGVTRYFNRSGRMLTGWQTIDGERYYFNADGVMQTGFVKIGSNRYYFRTDSQKAGQMVKGIQTIGTETYYFGSNGILLTGWQKITGQWRFFQPETGKELAVDREGDYWRIIHLDENTTERAYIYKDATVLKGWQKIDGKRYYFDSNGWQWTQSKGWLTLADNRYYFDAAQNNAVYQGFLTLEEGGTQHTYYCTGTGQMAKGWQTITTVTDNEEIKGRFYFDTDSGELWTGHCCIDGTWYYLNPDKQGMMATGYVKDEQNRGYYYGADGTAQTGWIKPEGETDYHYFDGAVEAKNAAYGVERTLTSSIQQVTLNGQTINYCWYQIQDAGCADNNKRYCFYNNTTLLKNRQVIDGISYRFNSSTGALYTGAYTIGQNRYLANADGSAYTGFYRTGTDGNEYYYDDGQMVTGWLKLQTDSGITETYYLNANGIKVKGIYWIDDIQYVFDPDSGKLVRNMVSIDGKLCYAYSSGVLKTVPGTPGVNISDSNGSVDWTAVKDAGVSYAMIRTGFRDSLQGSLVEDENVKANLTGAADAGLSVGVYFSSQAVNEAEAREEAEMVLRLISGCQVNYPVFIMLGSGGRADGISKAARTEIVNAFCETIQRAGRQAGVCAEKNQLSSSINVAELNSNCKLWLTQYNSTITYQGERSVDMWQYTAKGKVAGVNGSVEMGLCYTVF